MRIKDILLKHKNNNKIAFKDFDASITYKQLNIAVENIVNDYFRDLNFIGNIGIFLPNSIQYVIAYFTIAYFERIIVPIDVKLKSEIPNIINYCDINCIISNNKYIGIIKQFVNQDIKKILIFNVDTLEFENLDTFNKSTKSNIDNNEISILLPTSGSLSFPKRVMLSHDNIITNIIGNINSLHINSEEIPLIILPMYFSYCNTAQFLSYMYVGATQIISLNMVNLSDIVELIQKENITTIVTIPNLLILLKEEMKISNLNIKSLQKIVFGAARMPDFELEEIVNLFVGVKLFHTYGQTEASPRISTLEPIDILRKRGSVGKPLEKIKVKIIDSNGYKLNKNCYGEICIKGPNVSKGYYKYIEETNKIIDKDGWLHTGDYGLLDEEGYIFIKSRLKNIIKVNGINVYPEEVEEMLILNENIKEALVYCRFKDGNEIVCAKLVVDKSSNITERQIKEYCLSIMPSYKVPQVIFFVDIIEKTVNGKIKRSVLNE